MDIQTRPISDLPEMSKDSQTAQLMVYDEADQIPKRMPRSVMPVFVNFAVSVQTQSESRNITSYSHSPNEVKELLLAGTLVIGLLRVMVDGTDLVLQSFDYPCLVNADTFVAEKGIAFMFWQNIFQQFDTSIHAIDGSNTWEFGELPEKSST